MKVLRSISRIILAVYIISIAGFGFVQRSLLYLPSHIYVPLRQAHANSSFKELPVKTFDGLDLKGWYAPATTKPLTFVFFHGI